MANLISNASANISGTGGNSFGTCETATSAFNFPTSGLPSTANGTGITTTKKYTPTFSTTNGNVCDGILVYVFFPVNTSTGTVTFYLNNGTSDVGSVTVNAADFPQAASGTAGGTLTLLKLTSPVTLDGSANWKVGFIGSASQGTLVNATVTTNDIYKGLRLTTTATPASSDHLFIVGELTGQGTNTPHTVTMDYTSNTVAPGQVDIGWLGTLAYGTAASTNYYLRLNGYCYVWNGGTLTIGTSGSPIPTSSTAILEFNVGTNVAFGLEVYALATLNTYGSSKFQYTHLNGDVAASATSLVTADDTSATWAVGDTIVIAPTSTTYSQVDAKTISTISGTTITCPALTYAHSGTIYTGTGSTTFDTRAEIINITRNIKVRGMSATLQSYVNINATATVDCENTEFYWLGSATANKRGIDIGTTTGTCTFNGCSFHDYSVASSIGLFLNSATNNNYTLTNNVSNNISYYHVYDTYGTASNWTISNHVAIGSPSGAQYMFYFYGFFGTISNIVATGGYNGIQFNGDGGNAGTTISNILSHSNNSYGINLGNVINQTFNNLTAWRNVTSGGLIISNSVDVIINNVQTWGNSGTGVFLNSGLTNIVFNNVTCDRKVFSTDTYNSETNTVSAGGGGQGSGFQGVYFVNCNFGMSFPAVNLVSCSSWGGEIVFYNLNNGDTTMIGSQTNMGTTSRIGFQLYNGVAGNHFSYCKYGYISLDSTIYDVSPSVRLTPNGGSGKKLPSPVFSCAVVNGSTCTPSVKVRCSATGAGDSTSYNGAAPTLYVQANYGCGISSDTLLATMDSSYLPGGANQGLWYTLTGTSAAVTDDAVLSFYINCDGNAGWVNMDTASAS